MSTSSGGTGRGPDGLYPPIEPYTSGWLDVGDGQQLYWEECGLPSGKPVVFLHGGPGGGCAPGVRQLFDPSRYRVVLFDQRGCGRSLPHASAPEADLSTNTTWHLVADIERLREARGIERWQVFGGSWGSALGLAYAEEHPDRVTELILRGVFTLRRSELDFYYNGGAGQLFPDRYAKFLEPLRRAVGSRATNERASGAPATGTLAGGVGGRPPTWQQHPITAYSDLLFDPDPAVHGPAAVAWSSWEASTLTLEVDEELVAAFSEPSYAVAFARIENHYFTHGGWFETTADGQGQLLANADRLADIPGAIIQGRYDVATPAVTAYELHLAWPQASFTIVETAGHAYSQPGIKEALVAATDRFGST